MKSVANADTAQTESSQGSMTTYTVGFALSIAFSLLAYFLAVHHLLGRRLLIASVSLLAVVQFIVQLVFFLHLGRETKPRWKLVTFCFMIGVVLIIVFGSIWIMTNLNYHMTQSQIKTYLQSQDGL